MSDRRLRRRDVLKGAGALPFLGVGLPVLRWFPGGDARCLLILELEGGNDGLNTVVPVHDPVLDKVRSKLRYVCKGAHKLNNDFALHPQMQGLHRLFGNDHLSVVHGVGYPKPDRSHFRSRDIWHTADPDYVEMKADTTGWLGRMADQLAAKGAAVPGLCLGDLRVPLAMRAKEIVIPSLDKVEDYQVLVNPSGGKAAPRRRELLDLVKDAGRPTDNSGLKGFLQEVAKSSVDNAERFRTALARYRSRASYPDSSLGRALQNLAKIIVSGFGTRIFHVRYGGFDTHASQQASHDALLRQVSLAVSALVEDLRQHKKLKDFAGLVHSEFGRRVGANASGGTDHGTAGPVLLIGGALKAGLHGQHPDTGKLVDGDLQHSTDFRSVYGAVCRWMKLDESKVLGRRFPGLSLFTG